MSLSVPEMFRLAYSYLASFPWSCWPFYAMTQVSVQTSRPACMHSIVPGVLKDLSLLRCK